MVLLEGSFSDFLGTSLNNMLANIVITHGIPWVSTFRFKRQDVVTTIFWDLKNETKSGTILVEVSGNFDPRMRSLENGKSWIANLGIAADQIGPSIHHWLAKKSIGNITIGHVFIWQTANPINIIPWTNHDWGSFYIIPFLNKNSIVNLCWGWFMASGLPQ